MSMLSDWAAVATIVGLFVTIVGVVAAIRHSNRQSNSVQPLAQRKVPTAAKIAVVAPTVVAALEALHHHKPTDPPPGDGLDVMSDPPQILSELSEDYSTPEIGTFEALDMMEGAEALDAADALVAPETESILKRISDFFAALT